MDYKLFYYVVAMHVGIFFHTSQNFGYELASQTYSQLPTAALPSTLCACKMSTVGILSRVCLSSTKMLYAHIFKIASAHTVLDI